MFENTSVDEAITKGMRSVVYPRTAIFIMTVAAMGLALATYHLPTGYIVFGLLAGVVTAWLYWTIAATKWRVWGQAGQTHLKFEDFK